MADYSGAAKVITTEKDLSTRVGATKGAVGAMVLPALSGPLTPQLITSPEHLLRVFTPKGTIELGYDDAYFQALAFLRYSNKLLITRAHNQAKMGGLFFRVAEATQPSGPIEFELSQASDYDITTQDGTLAGALSDAGEEKAIVIYGANPGAWNKLLRIRISTDITVVKEPGAFLLEVFVGTVRVESFLVSRNPAKKDLRGRNLFIETVLETQSAYVRGISNPLVDPLTMPISTGVVPISFENGSDGLAVTDSNMIQSLNRMSDRSRFQPKIVFDSGWTTPVYQNAIINFAEKRGDCAFILSVPFEVEASSEYLNEVKKYKSETLNSVSNYGGIFTPHVQIFDDMNNRRMFIAPSGVVAGKYAETFSQYSPWQPVAGNIMGTLDVLGLYRIYEEPEQDVLYDSSINPIRFSVGSGVRIHGQKTLQVRPSDLDRMNVRMMLIAIKPPMQEALESFLFSLNVIENTDSTRQQVKSVLDNFLYKIKAANGITDFSVVCSEENNSASDIENRILNVWVFVKSTPSIEWIPLTIGITSNSMDFAVAGSLL